MSTPAPDISPLDTYHSAEDVLLLDVHEDDEWAAGHAPRAAHMALSRLDPSALNRATSIIAICRSGNRCGKAAAVRSPACSSQSRSTSSPAAWLP
jgi:rhodanese-related sulfurtransferase